MTNFVEIVEACENASGAGSKKIIKDHISKLDYVGWRLLNEALNPYRVFGVRKFALPLSYTDADSDFDLVFSTLNDLASRKITGDAARHAVTHMLSQYTEKTSTYLEKILDKSIKAGFSADTVNEVLGGIYGKIDSFELMLAEKCDDAEDFEERVTFPCQADFKYDGERTIIFVKSNEVQYFSRSGKIAEHLEGIFDEELFKIREYLGYDFVLDGERFANDFTETMNAKKSGDSEAKRNLKFRAFFLMPIQDWVNQSCDITMRENRQFLLNVLSNISLEKILISEGREVVDYNDMTEYCNHVIDVEKQEGLILKNWEGTYEFDRSWNWVKVKRFYPADARIVGFYKGRKKSRLENTIGGLICAGWTESGEYFEVKVGSGLSDKLRNEIMSSPKSFLGLTAVVKYQDVSRAKNKKYASLRFPTLEHIRDDKIVPENENAELDFKGTELLEI